MKVFEFVKGKVYHPVIPVKLKHLEKDDYINGFGINSDLYIKILKAKNISSISGLDTYDNREGYYIDGRKIDTRIHELHSYLLENVKNGKKYEIDIVSYLHYFGKYISLLVREVGSLSHKEILWENISCHYDDFVKTINKNKKLYKLIKKDETI